MLYASVSAGIGMRAKFKFERWVILQNHNDLIEFRRSIRPDVVFIQIVVNVLENERLVQQRPIEQNIYVECRIGLGLGQEDGWNAFALHRKRLPTGQVTFTLCQNGIVLAFG